MLDFKQKSTQTGLILLGSAAAGLLTGNTELITATVVEAGTQVGGAIPAIAAMLVGLWDTFRKEMK